MEARTSIFSAAFVSACVGYSGPKSRPMLPALLRLTFTISRARAAPQERQVESPEKGWRNDVCLEELL